ncbi:MAG: ATPase domain-containing protein [Anaerolineae bacterium]
MTLISGSAGSGENGSGRTVWHPASARPTNRAFCAFEETPADVRRNLIELGWPFTNGKPSQNGPLSMFSPGDDTIIVGDYVQGIAGAYQCDQKIGAQRIALDFISAIFTRFADTRIIRRELHGFWHQHRQLGITAVMTTERTEEYGEIARYGVEGICRR